MGDRRGATLIELIISLALTSLLFSLVFLVYYAGMEYFIAGERRSQLRVDLDRAGFLLADDLRQARGVTAATDRSLTLWLDGNNDAVITPDELVTYSFSGAAGESLIRGDGNSVRNLVGNVSNFSLIYDSAVVDIVRLVNFSLSAARGNEALSIASSIKLRNKPRVLEEGAYLIEE